MSELSWIRSHVERLLQDEWQVCRIDVDPDGDYPFRQGTAAGWVSVIDTAPIMVRVYAQAALGLRPSLKLFAELNEIQRRALTACICLDGDAVVVSQTITPVELGRPALSQALLSVGGVADDVGLLLAGMFGGTTPYKATSAPATTEDAT